MGSRYFSATGEVPSSSIFLCCKAYSTALNRWWLNSKVLYTFPFRVLDSSWVPWTKKNCCGGKIVSISSRGNCKLLNEEFTKTLFTPNTKKSLLKILRSQSFVNWPTNLIHSVTPLANGLDLGLKLFYGQKCDVFISSFPLWEVARLNRRLAVAAFLVKTLHIFITRKP